MIRPAKISESELLTKISFASKRHWNYPERYFDVWAEELTITREYIQTNDVFVYEKGGHLFGYYSIILLVDDFEFSGVTMHAGYWLEHMFIEPESIGKGIGAELFHHVRLRCKVMGVNRLGVLSDPNAQGFYENMGCVYISEYSSTIKNRTTPFLVLKM